MTKKIVYFLIAVFTTLVAVNGYAQQNEETSIPPVIESQPIVIIPWEEEDVDEIIDNNLIDTLDFGIGGDEYLIPAADIYSTWSNFDVNPYKQDPIVDTLPINLMGFSFPLTQFYRVNSEFGQRRRRYHYGIDLKVNVGDTVVSSLGGMVRIAQSKNRKTGYGYYVVVRHFNGLETFYAHLDKVLVEPNQMVTSGEIIGLAGNTGRSTGPHLHYEVRYQGRPINPRDVIDFDSTLTAKNEVLNLTANHFVYPKKSSRVSQSSKAKTSSPTSKSVASTSAGTKGIWTVKSGDTLSRIAARTGTSVNRLRQLNGASRTKVLRIGQKIKY